MTEPGLDRRLTDEGAQRAGMVSHQPGLQRQGSPNHRGLAGDTHTLHIMEVVRHTGAVGDHEAGERGEAQPWRALSKMLMNLKWALGA